MDRSLNKSFIGELTYVALRGAKYSRPLYHQRFGTKRCVAGALQANELGNILKVLAEDVLTVFGEHRHGARAEFQQLFSSRQAVQYVDGDEVNAFFRKKLFRSQATASPGLSKQDEIASECIHGRIVCNARRN
jgi:hypothetical protein